MQQGTSRVTTDSNKLPAESAAPKPKLLDQVRQAISARHYSKVRAIIDRMEGAPKLVATLLYGDGLRLDECLKIRFKDIDFTKNQILVRDGKGQKDRITTLPASVKERLLAHLRDVYRLHRKDLREGFGRVVLPYALARKYPNANMEWAWQWAFPAPTRYFDKEARTERRHHLHETVVQKAMRQAVLQGGHRQAGHASRFASFIRDSSVGGWLRYPYDPGVVGACRPQHDNDLYSRIEQGRARNAQPGRCAVNRQGLGLMQTGLYRKEPSGHSI